MRQQPIGIETVHPVEPVPQLADGLALGNLQPHEDAVHRPDPADRVPVEEQVPRLRKGGLDQARELDRLAAQLEGADRRHAVVRLPEQEADARVEQRPHLLRRHRPLPLEMDESDRRVGLGKARDPGGVEGMAEQRRAAASGVVDHDEPVDGRKLGGEAQEVAIGQGEHPDRRLVLQHVHEGGIGQSHRSRQLDEDRLPSLVVEAVEAQGRVAQHRRGAGGLGSFEGEIGEVGVGSERAPMLPRDIQPARRHVAPLDVGAAPAATSGMSPDSGEHSSNRNGSPPGDAVNLQSRLSFLAYASCMPCA